jgi:hypothetical protein
LRRLAGVSGGAGLHRKYHQLVNAGICEQSTVKKRLTPAPKTGFAYTGGDRLSVGDGLLRSGTGIR